MLVYSRSSDGSWIPPNGTGGASFPYDPIARPDGAMHALSGRLLVTGGGSYTCEPAPGRPATIATGLAGPWQLATEFSLVSDGAR